MITSFFFVMLSRFPVPLSLELISFLDLEGDTMLSRVEVHQRICGYVTEHELQYTADKLKIIPDDKLGALLRTHDPFTFTDVHRLLEPHFIKENNDCDGFLELMKNDYCEMEQRKKWVDVVMTALQYLKKNDLVQDDDVTLDDALMFRFAQACILNGRYYTLDDFIDRLRSHYLDFRQK